MIYINIFNCSDVFLDALVGNSALIEIKCPFAAQNTVSAVDALEKKTRKIKNYNFLN